MIDRLGVQHAPSLQIERHPGPYKLLDQERNIKPGQVVAGQVAAGQEVEDRLGALIERGAVGHVRIRDAVDGGGRRRNGNGRIDPLHQVFVLSVGQHLYNRNLHDAVGTRIDSGRLQIKDGDRAIELQLG